MEIVRIFAARSGVSDPRVHSERLDRLNGLGFVPTGASSHDDDSTLNYEPTVGPIASGGYAWVIFTSRRLYGNVATLNPWWSDPRFHDLSSTPTTKKLWVAAVDLNATPGTDPSHPAFYLPAQELLAGNSRGYWSADPCRSDLESCGSGDECCGGYCSGPPGAMTCNSTRETDGGTGCAAGLEGCTDGGMRCSQEFERCTTVADCCQAASVCASKGLGALGTLLGILDIFMAMIGGPKAPDLSAMSGKPLDEAVKPLDDLVKTLQQLRSAIPVP